MNGSLTDVSRVRLAVSEAGFQTQSNPIKPYQRTRCRRHRQRQPGARGAQGGTQGRGSTRGITESRVRAGERLTTARELSSHLKGGARRRSELTPTESQSTLAAAPGSGQASRWRRRAQTVEEAAPVNDSQSTVHKEHTQCSRPRVACVVGGGTKGQRPIKRRRAGAAAKPRRSNRIQSLATARVA